MSTFFRTGDGKEIIQAPTPSFDPSPRMALHQAASLCRPDWSYTGSNSPSSAFEVPYHTAPHHTIPDTPSNPSSVSESTVNGENKIEP